MERTSLSRRPAHPRILLTALAFILLLLVPARCWSSRGGDHRTEDDSGISLQMHTQEKESLSNEQALKSPSGGRGSSRASFPNFRSRRRKQHLRRPNGADMKILSSLSTPRPPDVRNSTQEAPEYAQLHRKGRKRITCRKSAELSAHLCLQREVKSRKEKPAAVKPHNGRTKNARLQGRVGVGRRQWRTRGKVKMKGNEGCRKPFFIVAPARRKVLPKGKHRYRNARLYGRWSRWTACSRSCTTQRFRWCKRPLHCGTDIVREEAYCYVEGSFCHRWIHRQIQQQPDTDDNEAGVDSSTDSVLADPIYNGNPIMSSNVWSQRGCGVSFSNNRTSYVTSRRHQQALRIIGGRESRPGQWPWQVAVLNRFKEAFCGGTLVAPHWILTAAHCVRKRLYVRLGEHDLVEEDGTEAEFRVEEAVIHPDYDADTVDNDVALLRLPVWASPSSGRGDRPGHGLACLPRPRQTLPLRRLCTIIGWGKIKSSDAFGTDTLHEAEVPIVSNEVCREVYEDYYITGNMFCAGYHKGRMDSCAGDSGGPLLCLSGRGTEGSSLKWTIFGITSFGEGCGKRGKYGIYTKVSNYVRWVQRVVKGYYGNGK